MPATVHHLPGLVLKAHRFSVPVDYERPDERTLTVFAREVCAPGREHEALPYLVFFQGGPGFGAPRPAEAGGWIKRALRDFRVLLLDQRGTGLSTPITPQTLRHFGSAAGQADYLQHFRADNIVRDAEFIRRQLIGDQPWSILGQSFGGFCAMNYLSAAPAGLKEVLITGGIPSLTRSTDEVYRATYATLADKNRRYYERYPDDVAHVRAIARHLREHDVQLPSGGRLTAERFQQLGLAFGASDGFETIHYLLEEAFVDAPGGKREISRNFLVEFEHQQAFDTNPIYALLHEGCYTQGEASRWSAQCVLAEYPQFGCDHLAADDGPPLLFTGEMIYPWMFEQYAQLQPLRDAAQILADKADWPRLYQVERLRQNRVPVAAAVYYDDMYVPRQLSEETAAIVPNLKLWITNEYEHNGLRADGATIVDRLLAMVRGGA